ncbi:hypothetical protein C1645_876059 [Glomus cerebriforme]|uniref:Uncharacterized protein n=1 Tax=Glomus cerebriforme TaxID=658196 RepID=A0A397T5S8_9GLOM|nr:hypothetical protein C1645_876059 [Glomus cerebriforme]
MTNINTPFLDQSLEEDTNKVIDKLGNGFNKLNNKLSNLLQENHNLQQMIINLENQKNEEIRLLINIEMQKDNKIKQLETELETILKSRNEYKIENLRLENINKTLNVELKDQAKIFNEVNDENVRLRAYNINLTDENENLKKINKTLNDENEHLKRKNSKLNYENEQFKKRNKTLNNENDQLKKENTTIDNGNMEWQNTAITYSLNVVDESDSVQLVKDIVKLQWMLEKYVGNLRKVDLNLREINKLLYTYKCKSQVKSKEIDLLLVKAVLQRYVFDEIIKGINYHFLSNKDLGSLERDIYLMTYEFLKMLNELSIKRDGANDIISRTLPVKIRQKIYEFLGSLGFANIIEDENNQEHPIISNIKDKLDASINNLRIYKDPKKSKLHDDMATDLIREVIRIFFFRLNAQEPVVDYCLFSCNTKVDPNFMEVNWDDENMDDNFLVELCSFPLIFTNDNEKDQKIYTRAKVVHQVE